MMEIIAHYYREHLTCTRRVYSRVVEEISLPPPPSKQKKGCIVLIQLDLSKCQLLVTSAVKGVSFPGLLDYSSPLQDTLYWNVLRGRFCATVN